MFTIRDNVFYNLSKDRFTQVKAVRTKAGRWQYRDIDTNRLYASGVSQGFWYGTFKA